MGSYLSSTFSAFYSLFIVQRSLRVVLSSCLHLSSPASPSHSIHPHCSNSTGLIFCDACLLDKPSPLFVLIDCRHAVCEQCADSTGFDVCLPPRSASRHLSCPRCKRRSEVVSMQQQHHDKPQVEVPETEAPKAPDTATLPKGRKGITQSLFILSPGKRGPKTPPGTPLDSSDDDYEII